ncbi:hypothetical protein EAG_02453 [Camponotus floridanus]|uniref:Uncharacterized protein n=1 Tax=Camponotus floridanus TaxID=104421 RepID=E2AC44_CAMFO|nr:hypothetical protein EAG_02453 [Camponotus floridanus]
MAGNDNIREREKIAREIEKTSESIRKKHRALKIDEDITVTTHFRPIIKSLQKIVDNSRAIAVKKEPESNADAIIKTLPIKRYKEEEEEEDARPKKRKRSVKAKRLSMSRISDLSETLSNEPPITSTPFAPRIAQLAIPESLAIEDVFETTGNPFETSVRNMLQTSKGQEVLRENLGSLGQQYMGVPRRG